MSKHQQQVWLRVRGIVQLRPSFSSYLAPHHPNPASEPSDGLSPCPPSDQALLNTPASSACCAENSGRKRKKQAPVTSTWNSTSWTTVYCRDVPKCPLHAVGKWRKCWGGCVSGVITSCIQYIATFSVQRQTHAHRQTHAQTNTHTHTHMHKHMCNVLPSGRLLNWKGTLLSENQLVHLMPALALVCVYPLLLPACPLIWCFFREPVRVHLMIGQVWRVVPNCFDFMSAMHIWQRSKKQSTHNAKENYITRELILNLFWRWNNQASLILKLKKNLRNCQNIEKQECRWTWLVCEVLICCLCQHRAVSQDVERP